jgi:inhibitor of KinA sporulation pathway (predicted exonuclease)
MNNKPITIFTALDLEMNQPSGTIIQVGAVIGDIFTGQIFAEMSSCVKTSEQIRPDITQLTGIEQSDVDSARTLPEVYAELAKLHKEYGAFVNPLTWGGGDSAELKAQLPKEVPWCFGRRWIDVKTLFVSWRIANKQPIQGGLAKSMTKVDLQFKGRKHNAVDDAKNTLFMYGAMLKKLTR